MWLHSMHKKVIPPSINASNRPLIVPVLIMRLSECVCMCDTWEKEGGMITSKS